GGADGVVGSVAVEEDIDLVAHRGTGAGERGPDPEELAHLRLGDRFQDLGRRLGAGQSRRPPTAGEGAVGVALPPSRQAETLAAEEEEQGGAEPRQEDEGE